MICPAAPPSAATPNMSAANWLNRLRSSRGFPSADAVDLGRFLAAEASGESAAAAESPRVLNSHAIAEDRGAPNGGQLGEREQLAEILRELFAMGGGGGESSNHVSSKRKSSRKQQNPKFWDATGSSKKNSNECFSDDFRRRSNNGFVSSGDNSLNQRRKERDSKDPGKLGFRLDEEEEEEVDLKGYSKSDVTVIDSSVQGWKSQMFVFRRNKGVWKVREKKSKSRGLMRVRRKRKLVKANSSDKDDDDNKDDGEERKKEKMMKYSGSTPGSLSENGNGKEHAVVPFINEGQFRDDKVEQILNGASSLHRNAPIKSFPCSSSHWKLKSEASSVILVKPISKLDQIRTKKPGKLSVNKDQSVL